MPKIKDSISVKVMSKEMPEGVKAYCCEIVLPASRFQLPDLLVQKGAMESLDVRLKRCCKEEVSAFLEESGELIGDLKKLKKGKKSKAKTLGLVSSTA